MRRSRPASIQPGERTGLRALVTGLAGEGERIAVQIASASGLAGGEQGFPGAVECLGFAVAVADLPEQFQGLLVRDGRLVDKALAVPDLAQPGQRPGFHPPDADRSRDEH